MPKNPYNDENIPVSAPYRNRDGPPDSVDIAKPMRKQEQNDDVSLLRRDEPFVVVRLSSGSQHLRSRARDGGVASLPAVVTSVLSDASRRTKLLPREAEVKRVIKSLLSRHGMQNDTTDKEYQLDCDSSLTMTRALRFSDANTDACGEATLFRPEQYETITMGMGGTGKTTIAAMAVTRPEILQCFHDGVAWLRLGQRQHSTIRTDASFVSFDRADCGLLPYQQYVHLLRTLCLQLKIEPPHFDEIVFLPGDTDKMKRSKIAMNMENARQDMSNLLGNKAVLIVMDDLWHISDLEWFRFVRKPRSTFGLLITTRLNTRNFKVESASMNSSDTIIEIATLSEQDSVSLLLAEVLTSSTAPNSARRRPSLTREGGEHAKIIAKQCGYLPAAIRLAGRLLSISISRGGARGEPLGLLLALKKLRFGISCDGQDTGFSCSAAFQPTSTDESMYKVLDRSFSSYLHGEVLAKALKLCFATFAMTFSRPDLLRPWVPAAVVYEFWDALLLDEEKQALLDESSRGLLPQSVPVLLLEKLVMLGFLDVEAGESIGQTHSYTNGKEGSFCQVHHDLMMQYAICSLETGTLLSYNDISQRLDKKWLQRCSGRLRLFFTKKTGKKASRWDVLCEQLHMMLIVQYLIPCNDQPLIVSLKDDYFFKFLPFHMIKTRRKHICARLFQLLCDNSFMRGRMNAVGFERGANLYIRDIKLSIEEFQTYFQKKSEKASFRDHIVLIFGTLQSFLKGQVLTIKNADVNASVEEKQQLGLAFCALGASLLELWSNFEINGWFQALDMFSEALYAYKSAGLGDDNPLVQSAVLHANTNARAIAIVPRDSPNCLRVKFASHLRPSGTETCNITSQDTDEACNDDHGVPLELSSHPGLAIITARPDFNSWFCMRTKQLTVGPKESALCLRNLNDKLCTMDKNACLASLTPCREGDIPFLTPCKSLEKSLTKRCVGAGFAVTEDGLISPVQWPEMALGLGWHMLVLLKRNSPNRLILKYAQELRESKFPNVGQEPSGSEGISLELSSHPGFAIVPHFKYAINLGFPRVNVLAVGPATAAIKAHHDGRILAQSKDGAVFRVADRTLNYKVGSALALVRTNKRLMTCFKGGVNDFVINEEGSISPAHSPNVVLGCSSPGLANHIVSYHHQKAADANTKLKPEKPGIRGRFYQVQLAVRVASSFDVKNLRVEQM